MKFFLCASLAIILSAVSFCQEENNTKSDEEAVRNWFKSYAATVKSGDLEAYRKFWDEDVVWLPIGYPIMQGIESCMEMAKGIEDYVIEQSYNVENVLVSDSLVIASVSLKERSTLKKDSITTERTTIGTFVLVCQPDGSWIGTHCLWYDIAP